MYIYIQLCLESPLTEEASSRPSTDHTADLLSDTLKRLAALRNMDTATALQLLDIGIR